MPLPTGRMTKNQDRTFRYRPGKVTAVESDEDDEDVSSGEDDTPQMATVLSRNTRPAATTFPTHKRLPIQPSKPALSEDLDLEGFVTASESSEDDAKPDVESEDEDADEDESDEESSEEASSSEEDTKPRLIAPTFISKAKRDRLQSVQAAKSEDEIAAEEEQKRQEKSNELLQAQIERDRAARAAGKKEWDDEDINHDDVDDRDDLDPEAEHAAWKLRELKRVRRDREALVAREKELEEIERRRNLTAEERDAEDREHFEQQKADQEGRGKMAFMQKYYHKGAFFQGDEEQDDEVKAALTRDLAGARFVDETNKEILPEYMRIRDMTKLGRKGRSKYKDLRTEDTGQWGAPTDSRPRDDRPRYGDVDDRFRPDHETARVFTGANSAPVASRRRRDDDDDDRQQESVEKRPRHV